MEKQYRTKYPSDVSDGEWAFVAPYLILCREIAPRCEHALRAVFNGRRYIVRTGNRWRFMLAICRHGEWPISGRSAGCGPGVFE